MHSSRSVCCLLLKHRINACPFAQVKTGTVLSPLCRTGAFLTLRGAVQSGQVQTAIFMEYGTIRLESLWGACCGTDSICFGFGVSTGVRAVVFNANKRCICIPGCVPVFALQEQIARRTRLTERAFLMIRRRLRELGSLVILFWTGENGTFRSAFPSFRLHERLYSSHRASHILAHIGIASIQVSSMSDISICAQNSASSVSNASADISAPSSIGMGTFGWEMLLSIGILQGILKAIGSSSFVSPGILICGQVFRYRNTPEGRKRIRSNCDKFVPF